MSRFIWSLAGLSMSISCFLSAARGPRGLLESMNPTVWAVIFVIGGIGWLLATADAVRGRF